MIKINKKRLIKTFLDLVKIPSPSWHEKEVIQYIDSRLKKLNIKTKKTKCGTSYNLLARISGNPNFESIILSAHTDTVMPCNRVKPIIKNGIIYSEGKTILGSDDKAAIAMFIEALEITIKNKLPHRPIEILLSCAEEVGLQGIKNFNMSLLKSKYAFVFDNSGDIGNIIIKTPYQYTYKIHVKGKSAHAGMEPEKGISAVKALASIIDKLPNGRIDKETTINVGKISGGTATNIVPDMAFAELEMRSVQLHKIEALKNKLLKIIKKTESKYNAVIEYAENLEYPGFIKSKDEYVVKIIETALENISIKPIFTSSGGGSDANILNSKGIDAVNIACGMTNPHSVNEYITVDNLIKGTELVLELINTRC